MSNGDTVDLQAIESWVQKQLQNIPGGEKYVDEYVAKITDLDSQIANVLEDYYAETGNLALPDFNQYGPYTPGSIEDVLLKAVPELSLPGFGLPGFDTSSEKDLPWYSDLYNTLLGKGTAMASLDPTYRESSYQGISDAMWERINNTLDGIFSKIVIPVPTPYLSKSVMDSHVMEVLGNGIVSWLNSEDPIAEYSTAQKFLADNTRYIGDAIIVAGTFGAIKNVAGNYAASMAGTGTALAAKELIELLFGKDINVEGITEDEMRAMLEEFVNNLKPTDITLPKMESSGSAGMFRNPFASLGLRKRKKKKKKKQSARGSDRLKRFGGSVHRLEQNGRISEPGSPTQKMGISTKIRRNRG